MKAFSLLIVFSVVLLNYLSLVSTLSFTLPPGQEKCLREEVHKDVLVTGEYRLSEAPHQKTHLTVIVFSKVQLFLLLWLFSSGLSCRSLLQFLINFVRACCAFS